MGLGVDRRRAQWAMGAWAAAWATGLTGAGLPVRRAQQLAPGARILLTVSGRIKRFNTPDGRSYQFSEQELLQLPQHAIVTGTAWTPRSRFEGPRLIDVLAHVGVEGRELYMSALNDYTVPIPWEDMERYGVILAHSRDGVRMGPSTYGPLWLMYPRDRYPDQLTGPMATARYIWQVRAIEVR
jgi:hypothetical protein